MRPQTFNTDSYSVRGPKEGDPKLSLGKRASEPPSSALFGSNPAQCPDSMWLKVSACYLGSRCQYPHQFGAKIGNLNFLCAPKARKI
eukprot:3949794-Prymnesium_polylepis.1